MTNENVFNFAGVDYDTRSDSKNQRHGGPFDRGMADSYYRRGRDPHFYDGSVHDGYRIEKKYMTDPEVDAYLAGFSYNEKVIQNFKDW